MLLLLALLAVFTVYGLDSCDGSRILMIPDAHKSHQLEFAAIANGLVSKGHDVYVMMNEVVPVIDRLQNVPVKILNYHCDDRNFEDKMKQMEQNVVTNSIEKTGDISKFYAAMKEFVSAECSRLLSDDKLFDRMEKIKFDLVIVDGIFVFRCMYLVPHRLGVPFISLIDVPEPWPLRLPWLPSTTPFRMLPFSDRMTFSQRLMNTFVQIAWVLIPFVPEPPATLLEEYRKYGDFHSLDDIGRRSLLYLITSDYHLDYALPMMPFMVNVPGLTVCPSQPLPEEYNALLNASPDGAVVVSFGSGGGNIPLTVAEIMIAGFARVNQTILWKYKNIYDLKMPNNVHTREWLPQNDLLAHSKVKLFITHAGNNGQHEALYHGVPMIAFPIYGDQPYNAQRIQQKGFGIAMDIKTFTSEELSTNINKVINDPSYKAAISKASKMFRERPEPSAQKAAFWIEHVIEYGADHLHSYSQYMPWYQFLMLDIAAISLLVLLLLCWVVRKLVSCLIRVCCKSGKRKVE